MRTGLLSGQITHVRHVPHQHKFSYDMFWHVMDLNNINEWLQQNRLRKHNKWGVNSLMDRDYVNDEKSGSITHKLQEQLIENDIHGCDGFFLMTHPRFLGFGFNSVSFYFCYQGAEIKAIVSEINNTPWGEKQLYFHRIVDHQNSQWQFKFDKKFHISPFVEMSVQYDWTFTLDNQDFKVVMKVKHPQKCILNVVLDTQWVEEESSKHRILISAQALKMWSGIYWQAFKLWLKKTPFFDHPKHNKSKP